MKAVLFGILTLVLVASTFAKSNNYISVYNGGRFVPSFRIKYNLNGNKKEQCSGDFSLGVTKSVRIPDGATNVDVKCDEYWLPGQKSTIFTSNFDGPDRKAHV